MTSKRKAAERFLIGSGKLQRSQRPKVERRDRSLPSIRVRQRELDRDTHVGRPQVRLHAAVGVFDHGMDGALRLHDDFDFVVGHVEQIMSLDNFEPLVHERRGVDRNLGAHMPGRMFQCLSRRDVTQIVARATSERPARCGDPQLGDLALVLAEQALVDCPVLGVDRHERARRPHRGSSPRCPARLIDLRCKRHDQVATDNEALLVRERQDLTSLERLVACTQTRSTHKRIHDHVSLG